MAAKQSKSPVTSETSGDHDASTERLFKLVGFPEVLYAQLRDHSKVADLTNRCVVRDAVDHHLQQVLELCCQAGFAPRKVSRKLVRFPLDEATKTLLDKKAEDSGIDATALLLACLRSELGLRLVDSDRKSILARIKRRFAKTKE